jgi:hypothetical protein
LVPTARLETGSYALLAGGRSDEGASPPGVVGLLALDLLFSSRRRMISSYAGGGDMFSLLPVEPRCAVEFRSPPPSHPPPPNTGVPRTCRAPSLPHKTPMAVFRLWLAMPSLARFVPTRGESRRMNATLFLKPTFPNLVFMSTRAGSMSAQTFLRVLSVLDRMSSIHFFSVGDKWVDFWRRSVRTLVRVEST